MKETPLACWIENDCLVIKIGINALASLSPVPERARFFPEPFSPWAPVFADKCGVTFCG